MTTQDRPADVEVFDGFVIMDGLPTVNATMTPECAEQTGKRLIAAAIEARAAAAAGEHEKPGRGELPGRDRRRQAGVP